MYFLKIPFILAQCKNKVHKAFLTLCKQPVTLRKCGVECGSMPQSLLSSNYGGRLRLLSPGDITKEMARLLLFVAKNITRGGRGSGGDVKLQRYWKYIVHFNCILPPSKGGRCVAYFMWIFIFCISSIRKATFIYTYRSFDAKNTWKGKNLVVIHRNESISFFSWREVIYTLLEPQGKSLLISFPIYVFYVFTSLNMKE